LCPWSSSNSSSTAHRTRPGGSGNPMERHSPLHPDVSAKPSKCHSAPPAFGEVSRLVP
jgi:hypothetical protein